MNDETTNTILALVHEHDGEWGWYQIDRALGIRGIGGVNVAAAMAALVEQGLVVGDGDVQKAATHYSITDEGMTSLRG